MYKQAGTGAASSKAFGGVMPGPGGPKAKAKGAGKGGGAPVAKAKVNMGSAQQKVGGMGDLYASLG